ncbi:MAG: VOC family protein [Fibrobacterota bacterium]|nr:VOC family protein [Fibrobacterota bacterium]QQS04248.1 MAG: VOC family protein [Fibrobacterota bacterium]
MFVRLAHVCLNVKSLERSVAYYTRIGFSPVFRFTREGKPFGAYLEIGSNQYIEMFEDPALEKPVNTGLVHFCLEATDLDAEMARLEALGISYTPKKLGCDHTYQIWLSDPDGNAFEVHQYTEKSLQRTGGVVEADW